MPTLRQWTAVLADGREVTRDDAPGRQVPADARRVLVDTDAIRLRVLLAGTESAEVKTKRHATVAVVSGDVISDETAPFVAFKTASGDVVRVFVNADEVVVTTGDHHRGADRGES